MRATSHAESPPEGCSAFLAALDAAVDGASDAHAAQCVPCAARLAAARAYRDRLRLVGERTVAPASLVERVRQLLQAVRGSPTH